MVQKMVFLSSEFIFTFRASLTRDLSNCSSAGTHLLSILVNDTLSVDESGSDEEKEEENEELLDLGEHGGMDSEKMDVERCFKLFKARRRTFQNVLEFLQLLIVTLHQISVHPPARCCGSVSVL
ncbi:hypothetical protein L596_014839 [Steinernema carpocapsae]|uniref:Uncharacterized protein n=1 Tax=Steinernema carpocapsae TaxID=34508 RepID=A0A4U5NDX8_STECR|nr:hypothetical protein L596_014839 [Steinernema carpocapsae]